jgi:hypothetical protein
VVSCAGAIGGSVPMYFFYCPSSRGPGTITSRTLSSPCIDQIGDAIIIRPL